MTGYAVSYYLLARFILEQKIPVPLLQAVITTSEKLTPVSVIEAMASGLCVVSTDVGGIPYLLENETSALLVSPDDSQAMAAALPTRFDGAWIRRNVVQECSGESGRVRLVGYPTAVGKIVPES